MFFFLLHLLKHAIKHFELKLPHFSAFSEFQVSFGLLGSLKNLVWESDEDELKKADSLKESSAVKGLQFEFQRLRQIDVGVGNGSRATSSTEI
ncbi:hypothetical protein B9Z55_023439 [Caenorhabditis nigoni]|uniref:Uncharacterized protein n=1 Tax=Caenorhabditis nigoni TaxID=1611254 RepID=A0A2G5SQ67_9PELO|nr:hypothetical protein B9Z55_023439 [Caenorhabditis nigoni]